ncbi:hypothetical protein CYY_008975 [Polysphondylium violaceum]|uniref:N-acetyltransferase domain-containing protein n=1 Tax=Polysphondylium violaceum TaxID=133409 RepID=A0A8J4PMC6_9MYCE|nr:hypothetical protein CYY_008975 [Polysphondylium violaceum]
MKTITIKNSIPYSDILSLRQKVFLPNDTDLELVKIKEDPSAHHFGIYDDDNDLIACITLIIDEINIRFSYFSVRKDKQKLGYGTYIMNWLINDYSKSNNSKRIWCNSRTTSNQYYKRFGFRDTGKSFIRQSDSVEFIVMEKILYSPPTIPYDQVLLMRQKVMYPNKDLDFVKLQEDHLGKHFGIYHNQELVSVMSIFINDKELQFRKLATKLEYQSKGFASILMVWLIEYSKEKNINRIWCNSRKSASQFYKKFGYVETNQTYTKNDIEFIIMEKLL